LNGDHTACHEVDENIRIMNMIVWHGKPGTDILVSQQGNMNDWKLVILLPSSMYDDKRNYINASANGKSIFQGCCWK